MSENGTCQGCAESKEALASRALREQVAIVPYGRENEASLPASMSSSEVIASMLEQTSGDNGSSFIEPQAATEYPRSMSSFPISPSSLTMPAPLAGMLMPRATTHVILAPRGSDVGGHQIAQVQDGAKPESPPARVYSQHGAVEELEDESIPSPATDHVAEHDCPSVTKLQVTTTVIYDQLVLDTYIFLTEGAEKLLYDQLEYALAEARILKGVDKASKKYIDQMRALLDAGAMTLDVGRLGTAACDASPNDVCKVPCILKMCFPLAWEVHGLAGIGTVKWKVLKSTMRWGGMVGPGEKPQYNDVDVLRAKVWIEWPVNVRIVFLLLCLKLFQSPSPTLPH